MCLPCFHRHTGFVRIIFCLFQSSLLPERRGNPFLGTARPTSAACLRQYVHKMTTIIGYHAGRGLSSEKRAVVQFDDGAVSLVRQMAA
jgi:hypothetical protein